MDYIYRNLSNNLPPIKTGIGWALAGDEECAEVTAKGRGQAPGGS